jgi:hypothetical protein
MEEATGSVSKLDTRKKGSRERYRRHWAKKRGRAPTDPKLASGSVMQVEPSKPPYNPIAWANERTPEEVSASLEALTQKRIHDAWPKAWRPDPGPAHRDGIRGSDLVVTMTKLLRQALTALETARPDKESDAIRALKKIGTKLKAGRHSIYDFQIELKGKSATKRAA